MKSSLPHVGMFALLSTVVHLPALFYSNSAITFSLLTFLGKSEGSNSTINTKHDPRWWVIRQTWFNSNGNAARRKANNISLVNVLPVILLVRDFDIWQGFFTTISTARGEIWELKFGKHPGVAWTRGEGVKLQHRTFASMEYMRADKLLWAGAEQISTWALSIWASGQGFEGKHFKGWRWIAVILLFKTKGHALG